MYKILIVEDDFVIAKELKNYLYQWKYEAECINDFQNILDKYNEYQPHLILLDISLPFFNGYYWCNEIRKISKVPIIFLSSASDNMNIIMAMNMGGDDFLAKPFDLSVMTAKIQSLLRRSYEYQNKINIIKYNDILLNLGEASLLYNNKKIELTKNEFKILQILFENAENIVSRDAIMVRLWESDSFIDDNTLTVNINRLRKKLENELGLNQFIITKKGIGYMVKI